MSERSCSQLIPPDRGETLPKPSGSRRSYKNEQSVVKIVNLKRIKDLRIILIFKKKRKKIMTKEYIEKEYEQIIKEWKCAASEEERCEYD